MTTVERKLLLATAEGTAHILNGMACRQDYEGASLEVKNVKDMATSIDGKKVDAELEDELAQRQVERSLEKGAEVYESGALTATVDKCLHASSMYVRLNKCGMVLVLDLSEVRDLREIVRMIENRDRQEKSE